MLLYVLGLVISKLILLNFWKRVRPRCETLCERLVNYFVSLLSGTVFCEFVAAYVPNLHGMEHVFDKDIVTGALCFTLFKSCFQTALFELGSLRSDSYYFSFCALAHRCGAAQCFLRSLDLLRVALRVQKWICPSTPCSKSIFWVSRIPRTICLEGKFVMFRWKMPAGVTEKQLGKMVGNAMSVPVIEKLLVQISESAPGHSV